MLTKIKKPLLKEEACKNENSSRLGKKFVENNLPQKGRNSKQTTIDPSELGRVAANHHCCCGGSEIDLLSNLTDEMSDDPLCRDRADFFREYFLEKQRMEVY